jgi:hypothetical protein
VILAQNGLFSKYSDFNKNHFPALPNTLGHHVSMGEPVGAKKIKKFDMRNGGRTNVVILRVPITNYNCLVGFWTFFSSFSDTISSFRSPCKNTHGTFLIWMSNDVLKFCNFGFVPIWPFCDKTAGQNDFLPFL